MSKSWSTATISCAFLALCLSVLQACGPHGSTEKNNGGMDGGGGGNDMKAHFITRANALTQNEQFSSDDRKALSEGLQNLAGVISTPVLTTAGGQPVANQKMLIAWTNIMQTPNGIRAQIQLKEKSKSDGGDSWEDHYVRNESLDDEIFHELMRASNRVNDATGKSVDEDYQISRGKYHLHRLRTGALQEQASTALGQLTTDYGKRLCLSLAAEELKKECQELMESESKLLSAHLIHDPTFTLFSEWQTHSLKLDAMLLKSDRPSAQIFHKVEQYRLQEVSSCQDFKAVGFEEVQSTMLAIVSQKATTPFERAYFEYVKKFDSYMVIVARFVRASNTESTR